eukprot:scaffold119798_cov38-Prasinocladus_malaysianus.AAC.1
MVEWKLPDIKAYYGRYIPRPHRLSLLFVSYHIKKQPLGTTSTSSDSTTHTSDQITEQHLYSAQYNPVKHYSEASFAYEPMSPALPHTHSHIHISHPPDIATEYSAIRSSLANISIRYMIEPNVTRQYTVYCLT